MALILISIAIEKQEESIQVESSVVQLLHFILSERKEISFFFVLDSTFGCDKVYNVSLIGS